MTAPAPQRVLLVGGGHTHALLLRDWRPRPDVALTLLSPEPFAGYSGQVPAWLAGARAWEDTRIDLAALCRRAGARFERGALHALEPDARCARLDDGRRLAWDWLSLDVGSTLRPPAGLVAAAGDAVAPAPAPGSAPAPLPLPAPPPLPPPVLALRPLAGLPERLQAALAVVDARPRSDGGRVVAVGGGPAAVEALLALLARLRRARPGQAWHGDLLLRDATPLPGLNAAARRRAEQALRRAGVEVHPGVVLDHAATPASHPALQRADLLLWATGAQAHDWQHDPRRRGALAVDEAGFVRVRPDLRALSHTRIFAVGDCAAWPGAPLPKAGVHAVRMAPTLSRNLQAALDGRPLHAHRPQRSLLVLLDTADGRAVAARGAWLAAEGRWVARWKARIDAAFLASFPATPGGAGAA